MQSTLAESLADEALHFAEVGDELHRNEAVLGLLAIGVPVEDISSRFAWRVGTITAAITAALGRRPAECRREERFPYELHALLAVRLRSRPSEIRDIGHRNLEAMRQTPRAPIAERWLDRWKELLELSDIDLEEAMLRDDEESRDLRQISPFAGALSNQERFLAMKKAQLILGSS